MLVVSVRSSAIKTGVLSVLLVACAAFGIFAAGKSVSAAVTADKTGLSYLAGNAAQRVDFLAQFGWEIDEDPVEVSEVIIPAEFDSAYKEYSDMQAGHGLDLSKYSGMRAKRWTYTVKNYPGYENNDGMVQANIFVLDGAVIGGDISSLEKDGFMQDFNYPKENTSVYGETTTG